MWEFVTYPDLPGPDLTYPDLPCNVWECVTYPVFVCSPHHETGSRKRLLLPVDAPAETRLGVNIEAASATGEANKILVADLATTQAGP